MLSCESFTLKGFIVGKESKRQLRKNRGALERTEAIAEHWASSQSRGQAKGKAVICWLRSLTAISGWAHNTVCFTNTMVRLLLRGISSTAQTRTRDRVGARVERGKWYRKQVISRRDG